MKAVLFLNFWNSMTFHVLQNCQEYTCKTIPPFLTFLAILLLKKAGWESCQTLFKEKTKFLFSFKNLCPIMHHELPSGQAIWLIIRVTCCGAMGRSLPRSLAQTKAWEPGGTTRIPIKHNRPKQLNVELT